MSDTKGEGSAPLPGTIKVQGITINPGEDVLVLIAGKWVRRIFDRPGDDNDAWMNSEWSTSIFMHPGPFSLDKCRHPDILTGMIREVDAD